MEKSLTTGGNRWIVRHFVGRLILVDSVRGLGETVLAGVGGFY